MNIYSLKKLPNNILTETASRHRQLRKKLQLSQTQLAERSGVSLGSIKRFEQTGKISFEALLKLAHVLDRLSDFERIFEPVENLDEVEKLFSSKTRGR
ncbi:MAG: helix-turn-helix transcriptional regulator [Bacteroidia bacterium]